MARVFVTGASGYVGGRLIPALLTAGLEVRCLARTPAKLDDAPWRPRVEVVSGEVGGNLAGAMEAVDVAVYLVHSIGQGRDWAAREQRDAERFGRTAVAAGVRRIVYLGGLGRDDDDLSAHLASRHAVGRLLGAAGVEVMELRAGVIIGAGSVSFEMLRYLVEVLPVMVTPRWVDTRCQPIGIADVIDVLARAITAADEKGGIYEIGGPDAVSYSEMMAIYADVAGLPQRRLLRVPFLTPGLSSHWVGLVTPVPVPLARELVESLVNEVTLGEHAAPEWLLGHPVGLREAITMALAATADGDIPTRFDDADLVYFRPSPTDPDWSGGTVLRDVRSRECVASPESAFAAVCSVGGDQGWFSGEWLWRIRGVMDQLVGGPGLRRGRRKRLAIGDALDFWRIEELVPPRRLRLYAEMRVPGEARLTWDVVPTDTGSGITQTALFRPRGLLGRAYWFAVAPFHRFVFPGLLAGIVSLAEKRQRDPGSR
jgi:uncharacterized protein YbjT (DUF2867 family)